MKRWVAALVLAFSTLASAENVAFMANRGGGFMVLTDEACTKKPQYKIAFSTHPEGRTIFGCWTSDTHFVHIVWTFNDELRSYPITDFTMVKARGTLL